jgi:hypothetical protein
MVESKTAEQIVNTDLGLLDDLLRGVLANQPWYRKISNELTTGFFGILQIATVIVGLGVDLPGWAMIGLAALLFVGNVLGINATRNGVTDEVAEDIKAQVENYVGKHRKPE